MFNFGLGFLFGAFLGSALECIALRSTAKQSFWDRSSCPHCKRLLAWYDLIPIFSYLLLFGRCRRCGKKILLLDLLVEILTALLAGLIFLKFLQPDFWTQLFVHPGPLIYLQLADLAFKIFIVGISLMLFITDISTGLIPDRITVPAIVVTLIYLAFLAAYKIYLLWESLKGSEVGKFLLPPFSDFFYRHALIDASPLFTALVSAFLIGIFFFSLIFFTKGRGMGGGDLKLGIFIGLALNLELGILALILAFFSGSIVGLYLILSRKKAFGQTIPFGPFLSLGTITAVLYGQELINWYSVSH